MQHPAGMANAFYTDPCLEGRLFQKEFSGSFPSLPLSLNRLIYRVSLITFPTLLEGNLLNPRHFLTSSTSLVVTNSFLPSGISQRTPQEMDHKMEDVI